MVNHYNTIDNAYSGTVVVFVVVVARGYHPRAYASAITFAGGRHCTMLQQPPPSAARSSRKSSSRRTNFFSDSAAAVRIREIRRGSAEKSPRPARRIRFAIGLPPFLCERLRETSYNVLTAYAPLCVARVQNDVMAKFRVCFGATKPVNFSRRERCHDCHRKP